MDKSKLKKYGLIAVCVICCLIMAFVETVVEPPYAVKSIVKAAVFLILPLIFMKAADIKILDGSLSLKKRKLPLLLGLGVLIYGAVMGAYALTRNIFDYPALVRSLSADQNVDGGGFVWVALYISFGNLFLEEFLFRFAAFIKLSEHMKKSAAYVFGSVLFAVYHIAMIGASFPLPLLILALIGLAAGGFIFSLIDDKTKSVYPSWIVHMFADFAVMTIWYIHL